MSKWEDKRLMHINTNQTTNTNFSSFTNKQSLYPFFLFTFLLHRWHFSLLTGLFICDSEALSDLTDSKFPLQIQSVHQPWACSPPSPLLFHPAELTTNYTQPRTTRLICCQNTQVSREKNQLQAQHLLKPLTPFFIGDGWGNLTFLAAPLDRLLGAVKPPRRRHESRSERHESLCDLGDAFREPRAAISAAMRGDDSCTAWLLWILGGSC